MIFLAPIKRRILYVISYEAFAILLSTILLMILFGGDVEDSAPMAIAVSLIALAWNYIFNTLFEAWEEKAKIKVRTVLIRIIHTSLFEIGLIIFTVPLYMWWYSVSPWKAFTMEIAILIFFLIYTFIFTWIFDLVFIKKADENLK